MMSAACPVTESSTFSVELRRVIERVEKLDFERWFVKKCAGKTGYYITPPLATKRSALVLCLSFFQAMCNFSDGTMPIALGAASIFFSMYNMLTIRPYSSPDSDILGEERRYKCTRAFAPL